MNTLAFLKNVIFSPSSLNGKWSNLKFRFMYILRGSLSPVATLRFYNNLFSLRYSNKIITLQPTLPAKIHRPYLHKGGSVSLRARNITEHYKFIECLPMNFIAILIPENDILLAQFTGKDGDNFFIFISTSGFDREGELMLSLYVENTPLARISFSFVEMFEGYTTFIGGLQGAPAGTGPDLIRLATKSCYGLFPKRIVYEALSFLTKKCGVCHTHAVNEYSHVFNQLRYRRQKRTKFFALYSEFWESVGGKLNHGIYILNTNSSRKNLSAIESKKRAQYRRRYELLDLIDKQISDILKVNHSTN